MVSEISSSSTSGDRFRITSVNPRRLRIVGLVIRITNLASDVLAVSVEDNVTLNYFSVDLLLLLYNKSAPLINQPQANTML